MTQHLLIGALRLARGNDHFDATDAHTGRLSQIHLRTAVEGSGCKEFAVGDFYDFELSIDRFFISATCLCTE